MNKILIFIFMLIIIIIIVSYIDNKKNLNKFINAEKIIKKENIINLIDIKENENIPKNIIQTYKNKNLVPNYIFENIKNKNKNWNYYFFNDKECREFLLEEYGKDFLDKFDSFKKGAHKSDLFRLCWLYKNGGVYIDIDTQILIPLDEIVKNINNNFTILQNDFRRNIYDDLISKQFNVKHKTLINSFIVTNRGNIHIKKCIENIMKINQKDLENNYPLILFVMQQTLKDDIDYQLFERSDNNYIPFLTGDMIMYDKNNKKIGYCKYKNYDDGKFN